GQMPLGVGLLGLGGGAVFAGLLRGGAALGQLGFKQGDLLLQPLPLPGGIVGGGGQAVHLQRGPQPVGGGGHALAVGAGQLGLQGVGLGLAVAGGLGGGVAGGLQPGQ